MFCIVTVVRVRVLYCDIVTVVRVHVLYCDSGTREKKSLKSPALHHSPFFDWNLFHRGVSYGISMDRFAEIC